MIHISEGNSKVGAIPSISLPPVTSCLVNAPCIPKCYARNVSRRFPEVRRQWAENLKQYAEEPVGYFLQVYRWLEFNKPSHFRFHVGGDIPDERYLELVVGTAKVLPIQFMLFTKRYEWAARVQNKIPNLKINLSMWPYLDKPEDCGLRLVWVRGDPRAPEDCFICKGQCTDCLYCWSDGERDILLKGH